MTTSNLKKLKTRAEDIIKRAEESGADESYYFINTFNQYETQLHILEELAKTIAEEGTLSTKTYVKGRENIYIHPAVREYNNTANSINKTVDTLLKIVDNFNNTDDVDPLVKALQGAGMDGNYSE